MHLSRILGAVLAIGCAVTACYGSAATPGETLVGALSRCDRTVFEAIDTRREALSAVTTIKARGPGISTIAVLDPTIDFGDWLAFSKPYQDGVVSLIGYFDEQLDLGRVGNDYTWGFVIPGRVDDLISQLSSEIAGVDRLQKVGDGYIREEYWVDRQWRGPEQLSKAMRESTDLTERALLVQPAEPEFPGAVRIGCSLQGKLTPAMLSTLRPDL